MSGGWADDGAGECCEMSFVWCCKHRNMSYFPELGGAFFPEDAPGLSAPVM